MEDGRLIMEDDHQAVKEMHKFNRQSSQKRREGMPKHTGKKSHLSISDLTIYDRAVNDHTDLNNIPNPVEKRFSSSSEEGVADLSDETTLLEPQFDLVKNMPNEDDLSQKIIDPEHDNLNHHDIINNLIAEVRRKSGGVRTEVNCGQSTAASRFDEVPQPSTSAYPYKPHRIREQAHNDAPPRLTPEQFAAKKVTENEKSKARAYEVPGEHSNIQVLFNQDMIHSMLVDEKYMSVASHLDSSTKKKIEDGQYIDFAKLVAKDRVLAEEENRVQLVMKGGSTYFVPVNESPTAISNVHRWDQAFRVYSDIYCKRHPNRSTELIQYSHVIHTAAAGYVWDNVYAYDRDFRLHLAENPTRSWAIILQQAWSMRLKDKN